MSKYKIYIDGEAGTTGLNIRERLEKRDDLELLTINPELRKDANERGKLLNAADFVFLCLPDDAAREAVSLIDKNNDNTIVIDASTAHRTNPDWAYGFPELSAAHEEKIKNSKRIAVPGCYAGGFISLVYPLVINKIIPADYPIYCHAVSGYSGGGKATIAEYTNTDRNSELESARLYALSQQHKHLPEMQKICGLSFPPMFNPMIDDFYSGMIVNVPIQTRTLAEKYTYAEITEVYKSHYNRKNSRVKVMGQYDGNFMAANTLSGTDDLQIFVSSDPDSERILLTARLDNLGKGASGAAVQLLQLTVDN